MSFSLASVVILIVEVCRGKRMIEESGLETMASKSSEREIIESGS